MSAPVSVKIHLEAGYMAAGTAAARLRRMSALSALMFAMVAPSVASASPFNPTGVLRLVPHSQLGFHANQSSNWFGYNQGTLEQGGKLFNSITGDWTVPSATQHTSGQAENSSDWIGIGGGCIDAGCIAGDGTLIQTGTEQDVSSGGTAPYSAWWELVPAPSLTI